MEDRKTWLSELIADVQQRKVDTIIARNGITGRAMPDPVTALINLYDAYLRALVDQGLVDVSESANQNADTFYGGKRLLPNEAARKWLMDQAQAGLGRVGGNPAETSVLRRISSTCDELKPVVAKISDRLKSGLVPNQEGPPPNIVAAKRASRRACSENQAHSDKSDTPPIQLSRRERAALSKAWELGTDAVVMQTTTMLDGDMITRIAEQYTDDAHAVVRQIHQHAVETSISTWERLVNGVVSIFEGLLKRRE